MKTTATRQTKAMKEQMKAIREILKGIEEDDLAMDNARSNYTYDNAMARNRQRFFDLMRNINEMAETAASIYNRYTVGCEEWMTAQATYETETI